MLPDIIETARLRLRPFRLRDVDDVLVYATDPEWARYLPVPQPYTQADAEKFIAGQVLLDREVHPAWAIEHAGAVIGGINLRLHFDHHVSEMGYSIARSSWGRGLTTESGCSRQGSLPGSLAKDWRHSGRGCATWLHRGANDHP
jgi:RimJ/RimL family protein N-acetyltransferase